MAERIEGAEGEFSDRKFRIAMVVGEESGDILGAGLMESLRARYPQVTFYGIGGPRMLAAGFQSLFPQDRLAVMGIVEPLKRLPELLSIRRQLIRTFIKDKPAVVIGIDSPDFNLNLELAVRKVGIKTAHYVSPSVWAWRSWRIKKIAKAVDLMLTLLPFEAQFYRDHGVPVEFVGHPLADDIAEESSQKEALTQLGQADKKDGETIVALLPGSRGGEVERMGRLFLDAASLMCQQRPGFRFLIPSANAKRHDQLLQILASIDGELPVTLIRGESLQVLAAADVVLMASGTTTLEALLVKRPMVIAYKVAAFSYWIFKKMVKVKHIGLPNLLADTPVAPEFIQHEATPEALSSALLQQLDKPEADKKELIRHYREIHRSLRKNASEAAAGAISQLIEKQNHG